MQLRQKIATFCHLARSGLYDGEPGQPLKFFCDDLRTGEPILKKHHHNFSLQPFGLLLQVTKETKEA